jgi:hypothetical protein
MLVGQKQFLRSLCNLFLKLVMGFLQSRLQLGLFGHVHDHAADDAVYSFNRILGDAPQAGEETFPRPNSAARFRSCRFFSAQYIRAVLCKQLPSIRVGDPQTHGLVQQALPIKAQQFGARQVDAAHQSLRSKEK